MATANIANTKVVPSITTLTPYYDDFDESKNFHRLVFRPGYAVQARELTQLQTILQNQIERFGNHIFENGSIVLGGGMSLDTSALRLNLQPTYASSTISVSNYINEAIIHSSGNAKVRAVVTSGVESDSSNPPVLTIKYLTGDEFGNGATIRTQSSNVFANLATSNTWGYGTTASIDDGIFFINGYFVKVPAQTVIVDRYSQTANARIGLEYSEDIITEFDDSSLLDPAQEASNFQAPGAARLQINFDLAVRDLASTDDANFVELMRVENGVIKKQVVYPTYSVLNETLARRTFDESGNYTVRDFKVSVEDHPTDNTKVNIVVDPGKAYVQGYEFETISQVKIPVDKSRANSNVNNEAITVNYGNIIYVTNVSSYFDSNTAETIDIHCAPVPAILNIGNTNSLAYAQTKIGTARVREIKYVSASDTTNPNTYIYSASLFDIQLSNTNTNVSSATANSVTLYDPTNKFSANNFAYVGSQLYITSGSGQGEKYRISGYNGGTKTLNIASTFSATPTNASNVTIIHKIASAEAIVATKSIANASANIALSSKTGQNFANDVVVQDAAFNLLVYPLNKSWIVKGSMTDQNYRYTGYVSNKSIDPTTGATITLATGETFVGSNDATGLASSTIDNFAAYDRSTGRRISFSSVVVNNALALPQAVLKSSLTTTVDIFYKVSLNSGSGVTARTKTKVTGNTAVFAPMGAADSTIVDASSRTFNIYGSAGQVTISASTISPNEKLSLYVPDAIELLKVYDLDGASIPTANSSITGYTDVTSKFVLDNGQRDSHYDHAGITMVTQPGQRIKGPLIVCFSAYTHSGTGYFSVDSYPTYDDIPSYTAADGSVYNLRDCIDFRPTRRKASTTPYTIDGLKIPPSAESFQSDYNYYLSKKSHLSLGRNGNSPFEVNDGISAVNPVEPRLKNGTMLLYKMTFEPYTTTKANVALEFVENKRYTMRDIGRLEQRIENLEYYQTLSTLEQSTTSMSIKDQNGLERTKYGILADDFSTHGYGDVSDNYYQIAVDTVQGALKPAEAQEVFDLYIQSTSGVRRGDSVMLPYTEETLVSQTQATKFVPVQPYLLAQWIGHVKMNPPSDNWVTTEYAPDIVINTNGKNDHVARAVGILNSANPSDKAITGALRTLIKNNKMGIARSYAIHYGSAYETWLNNYIQRNK